MTIMYKKIKKQLESLTRFQDIANAIRFVAGGELGLLRKEIKSRSLALSSVSPLFNPRYYAPNYLNAIVVPVTDDRGSCGSHNNDVIVSAYDLVVHLENTGKAVSIFTVGKKAKTMFRKFFKNNCVGYVYNFRDITFSIDLSSIVAKQLFSMKYDRIFITFNRYRSVHVQRSISYILGSPNDMLRIVVNGHESVPGNDTFFQSIRDKLFDDGFFINIYKYTSSLLISDALQDNRYSFLAGRFNGMDNTVKGIGDILESLQIKYNRARQEHITTELIEIISCKESIMAVEDDIKLESVILLDPCSGFDDYVACYLGGAWLRGGRR